MDECHNELYQKTLKMETLWTSMCEYVDIHTGELIALSAIEREEYVKIKCITKFEKNGNNNIKKITWECEKNRQLKFAFDNS